LAVPTVQDLHGWAAHLDALGIAHTPISEGNIGWLIGGLIDPDGVEIRLYTLTTRRGSTAGNTTSTRSKQQ
jgi:hypothetical protein